MMSPLRILVFAGAAAVMVACATDNATSPVVSSQAAAALISAPLSFDQIHTSFVGSSSPTSGFVPSLSQNGQSENEQEDGETGDRDAGHENHGPGWGGLMGGGIGDGFVGGIGFGPGFGRGPFGEWHDADNCAFSTTSNRLECTTVRRNGLTVTRSFSFLDASGAVQQAYDTGTTNTVNVKTAVAGTRIHHDDDTSTVNSSSDFTVTGLATGSTQRTVNGASAGTETTKGTKDSTAFTASRTAGDTTTGLVIPIQNGRPTFPTAGSVIRSMQAIVTLSGQTPSTSSRREVVTYDGSTTAKVVITQDGVTKNCTKPLPHGRVTCQ
jgi:hypothetical protein